jgi:hypothetical protein
MILFFQAEVPCDPRFVQLAKGLGIAGLKKTKFNI